MDGLDAWWEALERAFSASLADIGAYAPALLSAAAVLLIGWLVARVVRSALGRSAAALSHLFDRLGRPLSAAGLAMSRRVVTLTAKVAFWVIVLLFAAVAARVAGLEAFSVWLARIVDYLPTFVAGLLIVFVGYLLSTLVRDLVAAAFTSVGSRESELASLAAQGAVFTAALVIGLDQVGIDVTFLIILSSVLVGGVLLSIALAFGVGARQFVDNLIAARQLRGMLEAGDRARLGEIEGRVLEITSTTVVLVTDQGRSVIPAGRLQRQEFTILSGKTDD